MRRTIGTKGRKPEPPKIISARPLTRADLAHLATPHSHNHVQRFRDSHHRLARLVASGLRTEQVLEISGYSASSLARYRLDPAFQELIAQYRAVGDARVAEIVDETEVTAISNLRRMERMVEAHLDAADETEELVPLKTLASLISDRMDRFGYAKKQVNLNLNATLASKLETAIKRTTDAKQIGGTLSRPSETPRVLSCPASAPAVDQSRAERGMQLRLERAAARNRA